MEPYEIAAGQTNPIIIVKHVFTDQTASGNWTDIRGLKILLNVSDPNPQSRIVTISLDIGGLLSPADTRSHVGVAIAINEQPIRNASLIIYAKNEQKPVHIEFDSRMQRQMIIGAKWRSQNGMLNLLGSDTFLKAHVHPSGTILHSTRVPSGDAAAENDIEPQM